MFSVKGTRKKSHEKNSKNSFNVNKFEMKQSIKKLHFIDLKIFAQYCHIKIVVTEDVKHKQLLSCHLMANIIDQSSKKIILFFFLSDDSCLNTSLPAFKTSLIIS